MIKQIKKQSYLILATKQTQLTRENCDGEKPLRKHDESTSSWQWKDGITEGLGMNTAGAGRLAT